jgi:Cu2+-exporting ATPase
LGDKLDRVLKAKEHAIKTRKIIRENLAWSLGYNLVILPLAVAGLVAPYIAVLGMSASSVIVVTNSLRLLKNS